MSEDKFVKSTFEVYQGDQWRGLFLIYLRLTVLFPLTLLQVLNIFCVFATSVVAPFLNSPTASGLSADANY